MMSISLRHTRFARIVGFLSLLAVMAAPLRAMAETPAAPAAQPQAAPAAQLQQKYLQVRAELMQIETKAVQSDKALVKRREAFREQLIGVMKKNGDDAQAMIASLKRIGTQLQDKTLAAAKRQELIGKARQVQMSLLAGERKAMQDAKLQAASKELKDATLAAMRKVDANTDKLLGEMRSLEAEIVKAHSGAAQ